MIFEIIKHTPIWVFILLIGLIYLGYAQTKDRKVKSNKLFILPISMIVLSIFGIISAFGINNISIILWFISALGSLTLGVKLSYPKNIVYDDIKRTYHIPGSFIPMLLILIIFFIKYIVGVIIAKELSIIQTNEFLIAVSIMYGFVSGLFLSRSIVIYQSKL